MNSKIVITKRSDQLLKSKFIDWKNIWLEATNNKPHSYFLSWPWIEIWLSTVPLNIDIYFAHFEKDKIISACFWGHTRQKRHHIVNSDSYYLNYTGKQPYDNLTLEYNQIPGRNQDILHIHSILDALPGDWDEVYLPAMDDCLFPANCLTPKLSGYNLWRIQARPSYYVDLGPLGLNENDYLMLLSSNTRGNIRRAKKGLEKIGPLTLTQSYTLESAQGVFNDLVALHQKSWQKRGMPGAFSTEWFIRFHQTLIEKRFDYGEIQLLRIQCGKDTVGCIYNFVYNGKIYYYQSGFDYRNFGKYKPGLVAHSLAINHNALLGHKSYDFLAGDSQYKQSLSTHHNNMCWYVIQKKRLRFGIEHLARKIKAGLRSQSKQKRK